MASSGVDVRLSVSGAAQAQQDIRAVGRGFSELGPEAKRAADQMVAGLDTVRSAAGMVGEAIGGLMRITIAGLGVREFVQMADTMTTLRARMELATGSIGAAATVIDRLRVSANLTQQPLAEVVGVYLGASRAAADLGASQKQLIKFTEGVSASLSLSGTSGAAASGALLQLTQMLGGTNVQAQEFNSLVDGAPVLLRTVAANLGKTGVSMGELREMVVKGKLSSKEFFDAFLKGSKDLVAQAQGMPSTVGGAFTVLRNNVTALVGEMDKQHGATRRVADAVLYLADHLREAIAVLEIGAIAWFTLYKQVVLMPAALGLARTAWEGVTTAVRMFQVAAAIQGGVLATLKTEFLAFGSVAGGSLKAIIAQFGLLGLAGGAVSAAFAGWEIGKILRENFLEAQLAGIAFVDGTMAGWEHLKYAAQVAWAYIGASWREVVQKMGALVAGFLEGWAAGLKWLGLDRAADALKGWSVEIKNATGNNASLGDELGRLKREHDSAIESVHAITDDMADEAIAAFAAKGKHAELSDQHVVSKATRKALTEEDTKAIDATKKLIAQLESKQFENETEAAQQAKLTEGQKLALKAMEGLRDGTIKATDSEKRRIVVLLETILRQEAAAAAAKDAAEEEKRKTAAIQKAVEAEVKRAVALVDGNAKLQDEIDKLTLSKDELRRKTAAVLDDEIAELRAAAARGEGSDALYAQIAALEERKVLLARKDVAEAAKAEREEWQKTADSINNGLTDALMRAFESGKGFAEAFKSTLVNAFKTMILQPTIRAILAPVSGAIGTLFGGAASAGQAGIGAGAGGASLFDLSTYSRAYDALTGGTSGAFTSFATGLMGNFGGGVSAGWGAMMGGNAAGGLSAGNIAMSSGNISGGLGTYGGMAAGAIGGFLAGRGVGQAISGGYSAIGGQTGNSAVNTGAAVGAAIGSIIPGLGTMLGGLVGGAIGGIVNRAFGMGSQESRGSGVSGKFSGGQFKGEQYQNWHRSGGWFRSDQDWTDKTPLDKQLQEMLSVGTAAVYDGVKQYAAALGLPVRALADVTTQMTVAFGSDEQANLKALAAAFDDYGNALVGSYAQQLAEVTRGNETVQQTMERLGGSLISVNAVLRTMGLHLADVSVAGGAAAADLLDLTGGLDAFLAKTQAYLQNYFSEAEQMGAASAAILAKLSAAGVDAAGFGRRADLRAAMEGLDVNDADQRRQMGALLNVASDYAKLADYLEKGGLTLAASAADAPAGFAPAQGTVDDLIDQGSTQTELAQRSADGIEQLGQTVRQMRDELAVSVEGMWGSLETGMTAIAVNTRDMVGQLRMWDASGRLLTTDIP